MGRHQYQTRGTCSTQIAFDLEGDVVHNVQFANGCSGNLQALSRLVEGFTIDQVEERLAGIDCSGRGTSCGDQLAQALRKARKGERHGG